MRTFPVFVALVAAVGFASAEAAVATPPTSATESASGAVVLEDLCPFDVISNFSSKVTVRTFYDQAGNAVRIQTTNSFVATLSDANTGKAVSDRDHWTTIDHLEGRFAIVGLLFHINIPGHGIVIIDAGKIVFDSETGEIAFEAGPHDFIGGNPDIEAVCGYLAEP
jgi:hypothetical protein